MILTGGRADPEVFFRRQNRSFSRSQITLAISRASVRKLSFEFADLPFEVGNKDRPEPKPQFLIAFDPLARNRRSGRERRKLGLEVGIVLFLAQHRDKTLPRKPESGDDAAESAEGEQPMLFDPVNHREAPTVEKEGAGRERVACSTGRQSTARTGVEVFARVCDGGLIWGPRSFTAAR